MKINEIISNDEAKPLNKEIKQWIIYLLSKVNRADILISALAESSLITMASLERYQKLVKLAKDRLASGS